MGRTQGVTEEELKALAASGSCVSFSERERVALAYAEAVAVSNSVPEELFDRVRPHFSEEEIIELTATITWEICAAKFNRALEIEWTSACPV